MSTGSASSSGASSSGASSSGAPSALIGNKWIAGARPRTLPAAVVPVLVGSGVAMHFDGFSWWRALLALFVSLALQVGVNYANDYSDGVRGTDEKRTGPVRLVGQGLAAPAAVKRAAFLSFGAAMIAGLVLSLASSPWLILLGAVCVLAAWFYTGGKNPYGYKGLGEVAVFAFFGLAAVMGTAFAETNQLYALSFIAAIPVGLLAMALLVVNNLRDIQGDVVAGKMTLAVRLGDRRTRVLFGFCIYAPFVIILAAGASVRYGLIALAAFPWAYMCVRPVIMGATGRDLIKVLQSTAKLQMIFGVLFAFGLAILP